MHVNISFEPSDRVKLKADIFETLKYIQYTLIHKSECIFLIIEFMCLRLN